MGFSALLRFSRVHLSILSDSILSTNMDLLWNDKNSRNKIRKI